MPDEAAGIDLPEGAFDGRRAFHDHLQAALGAAARLNWREIVLSDADFVDWPLGERATVEALQAWSAAGRSMVLLAQRFDVFAREHARFVHWRRLCTKSAGLFSIVFDERYTARQVDAFVDALKLFRIGFSWAGPVSLVVPYDLSAMRKRARWRGTLVRFSLGLEAVDDLIADSAQALAALAR